MCTLFEARSLKGVLDRGNRARRRPWRCFKTIESGDPREKVCFLLEMREISVEDFVPSSVRGDKTLGWRNCVQKVSGSVSKL